MRECEGPLSSYEILFGRTVERTPMSTRGEDFPQLDVRLCCRARGLGVTSLRMMLGKARLSPLRHGRHVATVAVSSPLIGHDEEACEEATTLTPSR
ncbi:hypothetical protein AAFF_G00217780 [Aldrovandia affinis]|uniref:Uncharacterized protein n=1 Tax=Aldrovandia affinis TaxID=143900 RepID=A0AAD7SVT0_9TELE|nr:hypothetical protein AAFF_G00217780 [Aldrovandia affinis]